VVVRPLPGVIRIEHTFCPTRFWRKLKRHPGDGVASLTRHFGDLDIAEEAAAEAFAPAVERKAGDVLGDGTKRGASQR
jgi:hypothetical protein